MNTSRDWGYCVLPEDERVKQIPITPPLVGCEAERFLKAGARGWIVGFGRTETGSSGSKRQVEVMVNQLDKRGKNTIDVGDAKVGACHGDSGGPIYMHLKDGANDYGFRVFGATSGPGSSNCDCTCSTTYVNISMHIAEIEKNEMIDVTPCTDGQGAWAPGPACNALIANPEMGSGTFPACTVAYTTQPIASCGPPGPGAGSAGSGAAGTAAGSGAAGSGSSSPAAGSGVTGTAGSAAIPAAGGGAGLPAIPTAAGGPALGSAGASTGIGAPASAGAPATAAAIAGRSAPGSAGQGSLSSGIQAAGAPAPALTPPRSQSSGCASTGPQPGGSGWASALLLGIVFVMRRRRRCAG